MTRAALYDAIYELSDAMNTLQCIGEETMDVDEDDELSDEQNLQISEALSRLIDQIS